MPNTFSEDDEKPSGTKPKPTGNSNKGINLALLK